MLGYGKFVDIREGMKYDFNCIHMIEEYFRKEGKDKKECERYTESFKKRVREALKEEDRRLEEEDLWNYNDEGDRRWCKTIFEGTYSDEVMERYRAEGYSGMEKDFGKRKNMKWRYHWLKRRLKRVLKQHK